MQLVLSCVTTSTVVKASDRMNRAPTPLSSIGLRLSLATFEPEGVAAAAVCCLAAQPTSKESLNILEFRDTSGSSL